MDLDRARNGVEGNFPLKGGHEELHQHSGEDGLDHLEIEEDIYGKSSLGDEVDGNNTDEDDNDDDDDVERERLVGGSRSNDIPHELDRYFEKTLHAHM